MKRGKKALALLLAASMTLSLLTVGAFAKEPTQVPAEEAQNQEQPKNLVVHQEKPAEEPAEVNAAKIVHGDGRETMYTDAAAAFKALQDGETVQLLADYTASDCGLRTEARDITIDLNGCNITCTKATKSGYALKVEQKYGSAKDNTVIIKNGNSAKQSVLTSYGERIRCSSGNSEFTQKIVIEGDIAFQPYDGGMESSILLGTGAKLAYSKSAAAAVANGYFKADESDGAYIYGVVGTAAKADMDGTVELVNDYVGNSPLMLCNATLDLAGHTYEYKVDQEITTSTQAAINAYNNDTESMTVKNGKIVTNSYAAALLNANKSLVLDNVVMEAGYGIETNGSAGNINNHLTMKNSSLTVKNSVGIYFPSAGSVEIIDSTIHAVDAGVQMCSGSLRVSGEKTSITATGADQRGDKTGDGSIPDGAAISLVNRNYPGGEPTAAIENGKFDSKQGAAVSVYTWGSSASEWKDAGLTISGGTFSSEIDGAYLAEGCVQNDNGEVGKLEQVAVAEVITSDGAATRYATLQAAIDAAAKNGGMVKLLQTVTDVKTLTLDSGSTIDLNLNGHDLKFATDNLFKVTHGVLNLTGQGMVESSHGDDPKVNVPVLYAYGGEKDEENYSVITIGKDVTVQNLTGYGIGIGHKNYKAYGAKVVIAGKVNAKYGFSVTGNAKATIGNNLPEIVVEQTGSIYSSDGGAIYAAGYAKYHVAGSLEGKSFGIEIRAGELTIEDTATITASGAFSNPVPNGNGFTVTGAAIAVSQHTTNLPIKVEIKGGNISETGTNGYALYEIDTVKNETDENVARGVSISVTGGTFSGGVFSTNNKLSISGGKFSSTLDESYLAEGYAQNTNGEVGKLEQVAVAEVITSDGAATRYATLQAAIDAAADGDTVTMLKNVDLGKGYINITKKLTLDLNGCTITGNNTWVIGVFSDVTVKDSSNGQGKIVNSATSGATIIAVLAQEKNQSDKTCKLTIEGGVITATGVENSYGVFSNNSKTAYGPTIIVNGGEIIGNFAGLTVTHDTDLTVSGGEITGNYYAVSGNGTADDTKITINGGKLVSKEGNAIYHPQVGDMTICGNAELLGPNGVQYCGAGTLTIQDNAVITATGSYTEFPSKPSEQGDGSTDDGAALSIISRGSGYQDDGQKMTVNITGGTLTSVNNAAVSVYRLQKKDGWVTNEETGLTSYLEKLNVTGGKLSGGERKGVFEIDTAAAEKVSVSGGYFTSDPGAYVADKHYVVDSDKTGYSYKVTNEKPEEAPVIVTETVEATVPENADMDDADKATVKSLLESNPPEVSGVADALTESGENAILNAAGVTEDEKADAEHLIKIEIEAKVEAVQADLENGELTFKVTPVATVTVGGTSKKNEIPVDNSYLDGKGITVKLPVPADFEVQEIKHISDTKGVEYFLKTGTNTFSVKDGYAELNIRHFSELKLSGNVTAAAMVGGIAYPTLQKAIDAAGNSDVVTVLAGVDQNEKVTVSGKSLTIELGETGYSADNIATGSWTEKVVTGKTVKITYSAPSGSSTYIVDVEDSKNGTVTVSPKRAEKGDTVTITVKPDKGYELDGLTVTDKNGDKLELTEKDDNKYTFKMPGSKVTVEASFKLIGTEPEAPTFVDVPAGTYYADAVAWAVEQGITYGTSANTFSPELSCTRAQMVTFLWRANGSPKAAGANPFTDVSADAYYYDAVLWAAEKGITIGTSATTFSPDVVLTRGQTVTFLWRANGSPVVNYAMNFTDVDGSAYYGEAVRWAVSVGITTGTGGNNFSPDAPCTRAQIVTFLYRDSKDA